MAATSRVVVVGLGPAGVDLLVPAARRALEEIPVRYVRTARHPAITELIAQGWAGDALDDHYEQSENLEDTYAKIVATLCQQAKIHGTVAYAVPGSPAVAERTVVLLHEAAVAGLIDLQVIPGVSFAEAAWVRAGIDPIATGAQVVDGRDLTASDLELGGPLLIAQCDHRLVIADVAVTLLDRYEPETAVTVLQRLGLPDESVTQVALSELVRQVEPDHLTSLLLPARRSAIGPAMIELVALTELLRRPGGCPWDAEQTHSSLTRYLLEEAYEVVEVLDQLPADAPTGPSATSGPAGPAYAALADELGDLLYQIVFHAVLAQEAGAFDFSDVVQGVHDKLVRRHPHVFGSVEADTTAAVMTNWEQIKKAEKGSDSIVSGITPGLPALLYANKLMRKAASVGLAVDTRESALASADLALQALRAGDDALGDLLVAAVVLARTQDSDAESVLRQWSQKYVLQFMAMEKIAKEQNLDLTKLSPTEIGDLWTKAVTTDSI